MQRTEGTAIAALFAIFVVARAADPVPMLLPGDTVTSTLSPQGERKSMAFAGVAGSFVDFSACAVKGSRVRPTLTLLAPDGTAVDLGDTNPKSGPKAKAKKVPLPATGIWRVSVETPKDAGGGFTLSTKARVPLRFSWPGVQAEFASVSELSFHAAPGGVAAISVASKGRTRFDPSLEFVSPSGVVLKTAGGAGGKSSIPVARLDELGRYTLRVKGGPGAFLARATVKLGEKRELAFADVESPPEVTGFTPGQATNDALVRFELGGFAFSTQQTVAIVDGTAAQAAAPISSLSAAGAVAEVDVSGVPPGTYSVRVGTPTGKSVTAPGQLVLTNRTPGVLSLTPVEVTNKDPFPLELLGVGFDPAASVFVRRSGGGADLPVTVQSRTSHTKLAASVAPPAYETGPCDVEVRDPDGASVILPGALDLLGFRAPPAAVRQSTTLGGSDTFHPRDSAFDETNGRVLLALRDQQTCVLVLFDPATLVVADSAVVTAASLGISGRVERPRVAWDRVTGTFAVGLTARTTTQAYAFVRVVSATDLDDVRLAARLVGPITDVTQVTPAANADDGGYVVVWEEYRGAALGSKIRSQLVTPALTADTAVQPEIFSHEFGLIFEPVVAYQGGRRFVVAWYGAADGDTAYGFFARVIDGSGVATFHGPYVTASSANWNNLFQPELARNPNDGSMLLAFTYLDQGLYRPGVQRLEPFTAEPGPYSSLEADGRLPQGYIDSVRWNPERGEFVATMTNVSDRVAVRRVNPNGTIRASPVLESYEGVWGILWSGPEAGQLGLARTFDGTADDIHNPGSSTLQALAGRIR